MYSSDEQYYENYRQIITWAMKDESNQLEKFDEKCVVGVYCKASLKYEINYLK